MTVKIPCIRDKCILLPICKQKEVITCDKIGISLHNILRKLNTYEYRKYKIKLFTEIFPNTREISDTKFYIIRDIRKNYHV